MTQAQDHDCEDYQNNKELLMRKFDTGATRDDEETKVDFEGFLSPLVIERYGKYMHYHRIQADGKLRDSDNWQKGIPISVYIKSWWRHFFNVWKMWRQMKANYPVSLSVPDLSEIELGHLSEALCAALFNNMGMLHEIEKEKQSR